MYMHGIYMVYTMNILCMRSTYSRNIHCVYHVYTMYIHGIYLDTQLISCLAPGEVDAQGAPGTENSRKVPCLTGKTYKLIFLNLSHCRLLSGPKDKDNQTNS